MLDGIAQDWRLQAFLQREIAKLPIEDRILLKPLSKCSKHLHEESVKLIVTEQGKANFSGITNCKNNWCCPICTAWQMGKRAAELRLLLNDFKTKGLSAIFITLTTPHFAMQPIDEVFDILYNTNSKFFNKTKRYKNDRGYLSSQGVVSKFFSDFEIVHFVKVVEITYGRNGWHPHIHMLAWVPTHKLKDITPELEQKLRDRWYKCFFDCHDKYVKKKYIYEQIYFPKIQSMQKLVESSGQDKNSTGFIISRKPDQSVAVSQASDYICGWGADRELTGNYRKEASHAGHYTPHQMLQLAADGDKKFLKLYLNFCRFVFSRKLHKIMRSRNLPKIIEQLKQINAATELIKKKSEQSKVIIWFTRSEWHAICELNFYAPVKSNILYLARFPDLLFDYLKFLNININKPAIYNLKTDAA